MHHWCKVNPPSVKGSSHIGGAWHYVIQRSSKCGVTTASPEKDNNNNKQHGKETNKNLWLVFFRYPPKPGHDRVSSSWISWTEPDLCSRSACVGMWQKKEKLSMERGTWIMSYFFSECNKLLILLHDQLFKHVTVRNGKHFSWITPAFRTILKQSIQIKNQKWGSKSQQ